MHRHLLYTTTRKHSSIIYELIRLKKLEYRIKQRSNRFYTVIASLKRTNEV